MAFGNEIWGGRLTRTRNQDAIERDQYTPAKRDNLDCLTLRRDRDRTLSSQVLGMFEAYNSKGA
jgi:hypothetical protein